MSLARMRTRAVFGVALWLGQVAVASAQPSTSDAKRADNLFTEGQRLLKEKSYADACAAFEQSQELDPAIGTQLNIGLCYEEWGHITQAYKAFVEAARLANAANDDRGPKAAKRAADLKAKLATLTLTLNDDADSQAEIRLDGKVLKMRQLSNIVLDPGAHTIVLKAPGAEPSTKKFSLRAGQHEEFFLEIPTAEGPAAPAAPAPSHTRAIVGWTLAGLGVAALGGAGYYSYDARQDYRAAFKDNCDATTNVCNAIGFQGTSEARRHANISSFVAGGGLAIAVTGIVVLLTGKKSKAPTDGTAWYLAPTFGANKGGLALRGRF